VREVGRQAPRKHDAFCFGDDLGVVEAGVVARAVDVDPLGVLAADLAAAGGQCAGVVDRGAELDVVVDFPSVPEYSGRIENTLSVRPLALATSARKVVMSFL